MELDVKRVKKYEKWIILAVCFILVFLMYGQTLWGDFVFDDRGIVDHASMLSDPNQLHRTLSLPYWTAEAALYRPTTLLSYAFNFFFLGRGAWGFHFINLLLYALTGFLTYWLVFRLFTKRSLAYLTAVLFLVLPIHSEAVANIIGRAEILALFFSLLFFRELLKEPSFSWKNFWLPGLWFLLAMGSKETAIAALPIAALIIWLKERALSRQVFFKYLYPALAIFSGALIYFGARFLVLGREYFLSVQTTLVENPLMFTSAQGRLAAALEVLAMYLQKTFWPPGLCSDYSFNQIPVAQSFLNWSTLLGAGAFIILIAGIFVGWKKAPVLSFGCAWFVLSFFLVSNFLLPIGTIAGERLMFYPSLGLCLIVAAMIIYAAKKLADFFRRRAIGAAPFSWFIGLALLSALIIFYGLASWQRAGDWLTEKRLFVSAAACAPKSVLSQSNLGAVYYLEGNLPAAKEALLQAQAIYPDYPKGVNNLGLVFWKEGDRVKARELYLKALSYKFPYYGAYENLALLAIEDKNWAEAKDWLLKFYSGNQAAAETYLRAYRGW